MLAIHNHSPKHKLPCYYTTFPEFISYKVYSTLNAYVQPVFYHRIHLPPLSSLSRRSFSEVIKRCKVNLCNTIFVAYKINRAGP
jgi:hypothetical protein